MIPLGFPLDLSLTLWRLSHGAADPTTRLSRAEAWRATRTPEGPASLHLSVGARGVEAEAWGEGAYHALEHLPELLGLDDDPSRLVSAPGVVGTLARRLPGLRIGRTGAVLEALVPAVLEQKVPGVLARRAHARMTHALGEPAPGPAGRMGMALPPASWRLADLPYFAFHRFGIERRRAETIRSVASGAARLEEAANLPPRSAARLLTAFRGVGPWTAAEVVATALGDPDAVSVGDFHIPHLVAWNLAGEPRATDSRMLELLEPYRGQRGRVIRLLEAGGSRPPRYGPRLEARSIARI
jgi:3-methyladenine DNA glycosylase/8-oxoguanine DNA glycosylase